MDEQSESEGGGSVGLPQFLLDPVGVVKRRWRWLLGVFARRHRPRGRRAGALARPVRGDGAAADLEPAHPRRVRALDHRRRRGRAAERDGRRGALPRLPGLADRGPRPPPQARRRRALRGAPQRREQGHRRRAGEGARHGREEPGLLHLRRALHLERPLEGGGRRQRAGDAPDRLEPRPPRPPGAPHHRLPAPRGRARRGRAEGAVQQGFRVQGAAPRRAAGRARQQGVAPRAAPGAAPGPRAAHLGGREPARHPADAGRRSRPAQQRALRARGAAPAREDDQHGRAPERARPRAPGGGASRGDLEPAPGRQLVADPARRGVGASSSRSERSATS